MDDKEYSNVYAIPANYTDSGKFFGGMLEPRNTIEAILLVALVGYPELMWVPVPGSIKVVIMTVTLLPLAVVALMGIAGDSLVQYFGHMSRHWIHRRKLHYRRIGYNYEKAIKNSKQAERTAKKKKSQKQKDKKQDGVRPGSDSPEGNT